MYSTCSTLPPGPPSNIRERTRLAPSNIRDVTEGDLDHIDHSFSRLFYIAHVKGQGPQGAGRMDNLPAIEQCDSSMQRGNIRAELALSPRYVRPLPSKRRLLFNVWHARKISSDAHF